MAQEFEQVDQTELPYSLEAEQTILGSIFVDRKSTRLNSSH